MNLYVDSLPFNRDSILQPAPFPCMLLLTECPAVFYENKTKTGYFRSNRTPSSGVTENIMTPPTAQSGFGPQAQKRPADMVQRNCHRSRGISRKPMTQSSTFLLTLDVVHLEGMMIVDTCPQRSDKENCIMARFDGPGSNKLDVHTFLHVFYVRFTSLSKETRSLLEADIVVLSLVLVTKRTPKLPPQSSYFHTTPT
ncbi:hypothetical protein TNCV_3223031 [Trichonephila clavipes]|nr:hypothetical protein TNCV_3223031 [Trichonephila clavipes]